MASALVGSLRVNLAANTAAFSQGLKSAEGGLQRFAKHAKVAAAAIAGAMTAAVAGLTVAMRGMINEADRMGKMAQSIGVPVDELSRLKHAADLSGVSLEQLSTSVGRLSRNMLDVSKGVGAEAARAFDQLGISVSNVDGSLKSSSQIMAEVADRFSRMEDGAEKTALAMQIFGRAGRDMIPMLNQGADGLNAMMREADELGIVIDSRTAKAAEAFNDNLTRLGKVKDGIITQLTAFLLPALRDLSKLFIDAVKNGELVRRTAEGMIRVFKFLFFEIARVGIEVRQLRRDFAALADIAAGGFKLGVMSGTGLDQLKSGIQALRDSSSQAERELEELRQTVENFGRTTARDRIDQAFEDFGESIKGAASEMEGVGQAISRAGAAAEKAGKPLDLLPPKLNEISRAGQQVSSTLESAFSSLFDSAVDGTFKLRDAIGNLLKDLGRLLANQAFRSLLGGFGGGAGQPLNLLPGFAQGGSFRVGGSGGIDSQLVAFRATPGEQVEIRKPGQDGGGGATANIVVNMDARGADRDGIMQAVARLERELPRRAVEAVREAQSRRALA